MKKKLSTYKNEHLNADRQTDGTLSFLMQPMVLAILAFVLSSLLYSILIYQRYDLITQSRAREDFAMVNLAKDRLQESLTHSLSVTKAMSLFINNNGEVSNFDSIAPQILQLGKDIDAIQLVPDGVIRYVYPLDENKAVIGYDILKDTTRNKEAYKAIELNKMFFAGPFELRQGGLGVVGRLPIYRNNKFWGFSAVVVKMSTLFATAQINESPNSRFYYQLSKINPDTKEEEFFLPVHASVDSSQSAAISVPNGEWKLSVSRKHQHDWIEDIGLLAFGGLLFSFLGALFAYRIASRPNKLNKIVKARTAELAHSERRYRSVIERVSDAFVALDLDWNYTYVNEKAGELFGRDSKSLQGKNIWEEFPEGVGEPFYHAYFKAMETQEYQFLDEYFQPYDKWFENHIYPSKDGLTIFFKDVTEVKQITQALQLKEEKYRSLIEQASDGIVITNMEGIIVEVNRSITQMLGFTVDEMLGKQIEQFLPEEDRTEIPIRINELMKGSNLLYERRLIKKDGTFLEVEINSKMASSHTLIGFIRDITERKQSQERLKQSNERFELIAEATNDAVWDHDLIKNETWGNNKLYNLYGLEPGGMRIDFETFIERIHPDDRTGVEERMKNAIDKQLVFLSENFRFRTEADGYRIFNDRAYINYDSNGKPLRILGAMHDITEAEQAKKAILESEEKFRAIIEQASDGIFIADAEAYFIDVNSAGCRMLGYTLEELKKIRFLDLIPPEDKISNPVRIFNLPGGASLVNERRLTCKDGMLINVEISAQKLLDGRFQSFARDITERKKASEKLQQSEEKYRLLFYNNPQPMWMTTIPDFDILDVNEAAIKNYGYSREEFLKLNLKDMRPAEDVAYFTSSVENIDLAESNNRQWRHKKKDGTIIEVEVITHEIEYEGKTVWLSLPHDITEEHHAKELLQKSYEEIRQLASNLQNIREDERTNIAREIHDELGQQLTGLKMDLHWLMRKINSSDQEVTTKMNESLELINATITSVRKISTDLRPSILDDLGLLPALEWQGTEFEKRSGIKVIFNNKAGDIKVKPEATTGIFRIYQELLTNIARHSTATLVRAVLHQGEDRLYFNVADNGVGMDSEKIKHKKTLGLLGIKERTLLLGGTYKIKSEPGNGVAVTISLPGSVINNNI